MKKVLALFVTAILFLGCSSSKEENSNIEAKIAIGKSLKDLKLKNQNEKTVTLPLDTKTVFFSFSKATAHACNKLLESKPADFLQKNRAVYVADISSVPSIIKNMLILPDLKKLKFQVLLMNDENLSKAYIKGVDTKKIVLVRLNNLTITEVKRVQNEKELEDAIVSQQ